MTQAVAQVRNSVARTGFANPLTLGVLVEDVDQLKVYADSVELQVGVDYSVEGIGDANGVEIEIIGAEDVNEFVGIESFTALFDPNFDQLTDLSLGGGMGRPFETALDQQNRRLQALASRVDRALKVPVDIEGDQVVTPVAGYALGFDEDGNLVALAPGSLGFAEAIVAAAVGFTPVGSVIAANVQAALAEVVADLDDAVADIVALYLAASDLDTALDTKQPLAAQLTALAAISNPAVPGVLRYDPVTGAPAYATATKLTGRGVLWGLGTANNVSDATNDIDISPGAVVDSTGQYIIELASAVTRRLDGTSFTTGNNGVMRDTGSISDGTWHLFAILNPTTGDTQVLASKSLSAPTLPSGYTVFGRFMSVLRVSSALVPYLQDGDRVTLKTPVNNLNAGSLGTSAVTLALSIPTGLPLVAEVAFGLTNSASTGTVFGLVTSLSATDVAPTEALCHAATYTPSGGSAQTRVIMLVRTDSSAQVRYRLSDSAAAIKGILTTLGWIDTRGRT